MNYTDLVKPEVLTQPVYEPGKPIEDVARACGLDPKGILKLASNENPLGPSPGAVAAANEALAHAHLYPDGTCTGLREAVARQIGVGEDQLLFGNGSNELFELLGHAFLRPGDECVMGVHAFIVYKLVTLLFGAKPIEVPMPEYTHDLHAMASAVTERTRMVFLPSPNNPTGTTNAPADIIAFARDLPEHVLFVHDEAYAEYEDDYADLRPLIQEGYKILCTRTFSKIYGMAAFRIGYAYASPELIGLLQRVRQPFNVNAIAQAAAIGALQDTDFVQKSKAVNDSGMRQLRDGLTGLGLECVGGAGNFVMARVPKAGEAFGWLQKRGVIVRPIAGYGLPEFLRISIGTAEENETALKEIGQWCREAEPLPGQQQ